MPVGTKPAAEPDNNFCSENEPVLTVNGLETVTACVVPLPIVIDAPTGLNTGVPQFTPPNDGVSSVNVTVAPVGKPEITVGVAPATRLTAVDAPPLTLYRTVKTSPSGTAFVGSLTSFCNENDPVGLLEVTVMIGRSEL